MFCFFCVCDISTKLNFFVYLKSKMILHNFEWCGTGCLLSIPSIYSFLSCSKNILLPISAITVADQAWLCSRASGVIWLKKEKVNFSYIPIEDNCLAVSGPLAPLWPSSWKD